MFKSGDNFRLLTTDIDAETEKFKVTIVVPPFSDLTFSDPSVFQAFEFDTFAPEEHGIEDQETGWVMSNETEVCKHFVADREIKKGKIGMLRILAKSVLKGPVIGNNLNANLNITFKYNGPIEPVNKVDAIVPDTYAVDMSKGIEKKVATAILFYSNLL